MDPTEEAQRKQARVAAIVMAATVIIWLAGSFVGGRLELAPRFAVLLDFAALAAFAWSVIVLIRVLMKLRS
ncbi:MAG: DUF5337 family protein [Pseudomonadota bacterium]